MLNSTTEIELADPNSGKRNRTNPFSQQQQKNVKKERQKTIWGVKRSGGGMQSMDLVLDPNSNKYTPQIFFKYD